MTKQTQGSDHGRHNAFVRKPTYRSAVNDFFVGEIVHCKRLGGQNIVMRQARMVGHDRLERHAGTQSAQDAFYRNSRTANDRLAVHDIGVSFDPFVRHDILMMVKTDMGQLVSGSAALAHRSPPAQTRIVAKLPYNLVSHAP